MTKTSIKSVSSQPPDDPNTVSSTRKIAQSLVLSKPSSDIPSQDLFKGLDKDVESLSFMEGAEGGGNLTCIDDFLIKTDKAEPLIVCNVNATIRDFKKKLAKSKKKLADSFRSNLWDGDVRLSDLEKDLDALCALEGCDLYEMPALPKNKENFKHSYIATDNQLHYIDHEGECKPVSIKNPDLFQENLNVIRKKMVNNKMRLSDEKAHELITSNGNHTYEKLTVAEKIDLAACKQAIAAAIEKHLKLLVQTDEEKEIEKRNANISRYWDYFNKIRFFLLLGSGLAVDSFGSFEGSDSLFQLIPGMLDPVALALNITFSVVNSILFVAFEGGMLQRYFGISLFGKAEREILQSKISQIDSTKEINNKVLGNDKVIEKILPVYPKFASIITKLNNDVKTIKDNFTMPEESKSRKRLRYFITGFGAFMFSGWACYTAFGFLGAALLASGIGGGFILAAVIISSLFYYYAMQAQGVDEMMNPTRELSEELNTKINAFDLIEKKDFDIRLEKEIVYAASKNAALTPDTNKPQKNVVLISEPAKTQAAPEVKDTPLPPKDNSPRKSIFSIPGTSQTKKPSISDPAPSLPKHFRSHSFSSKTSLG